MSGGSKKTVFNLRNLLFVFVFIFFIASVIAPATYYLFNISYESLFTNRTEVSNLGLRPFAPVLFMDFNKPNESSYVQDNSIYNNFGTLGATTAAPFWNATGGYDGSGAYNFDGGDYMTASRLSGTSSFTFSAWIRYSSLSGTYAVPFWNGVDSSTAGFGLGYRKPSSRVLYSGWGSSTGEVTGLTSSDNTWYFVTSAYNGTSNSFYINGILQGSASYSSSNFNSGNLNIGGLGAGYYFNGAIDQVQIFNRSLSALEVLCMYNGTGCNGLNNSQYVGKYANGGDYRSNVFYNSNSTYWNVNLSIADTNSPASGIVNNKNEINLSNPNLVGYWALDGNFRDARGINNGTPIGGVNNATGISSGAMRFDAVDDYVNLSLLPLNANINFSLSAFVKTPALGTRRQISTYGSLTTNQGVWFFVGTDEKLHVDLSNTGGPTSSATVGDNNWHHVLMTNSAGSIQLYVDGVASGSPVSMSPNIQAGSQVIGRSLIDYGTPWYFNGTIDEILIYNKSLSQLEITQLYKSGLSQHATTNITLQTRIASGYNISDPSLVGLWGLNNDSSIGENSDFFVNSKTSLLDSSPHRYWRFLQEAITLSHAPRTDELQWIDSNNIIRYPSSYSCGGSFQDSSLCSSGAFDNTTSCSDVGWIVGNGGYVAVDFGSAISIQKLKAHSSYAGGSRGARWLIQYSDDNSNWITVKNWTYSSGGCGWFSTANDNLCYLTSSTCPILNSTGLVGNSMRFDGSNDYLVSNKPLSNIDNWSISAWINPLTLPQYDGFVVNVGDYNTGYGFSVGGADTTNSKLYGLYNMVAWIDSGYTFPSTNNWYYITMTRRSGTLFMYVNGVQVYTGSSSTPIVPVDSMAIGRIFQAGDTRAFNGLIDEVRIYNRSLNVSEIQDLYNLGNYHLNWNNNGVFSSESVVLDGAGLLTAASGKFMQYKTNFYTNDTNVVPYLINHNVSISSLSFPTVTLVSPLTENISNNFTQSFFCNASSSVNLANVTLFIYNSTNLIYNNTTSLNTNAVNLGWNYTLPRESKYFWNCNAYSNQSLGASALLNSTLYITSVVPFVNFSASTPLNGTITNTSSILFNVTMNKNASACRLSVGASTYFMTVANANNLTSANYTLSGLSSGSYSFYAICNDSIGATVYTDNRTIILDLSSPGANLSSPLNNSFSANNSQIFSANLTDVGNGLANATLYVYNSSDLVYNQTKTSGITYNYSYNPALNFDGSNDYVITPNINAYFSTDSVTWSVWFKANAAGVVVTEIGQASINSAWHDSHIEVLSNGNVVVRVWQLSSVSLGTISFGSWHHVVLRYNETTDKLDGFLDGVEAATDVTGDRYRPGENGYNQYYALGAVDGTHMGSGAYLNGAIESAALWNRYLNSSEIALLYNSGYGLNINASVAPYNSGLVLGWAFNETSGTTVRDLSGNNLAGTLSGSPTWLSNARLAYSNQYESNFAVGTLSSTIFIPVTLIENTYSWFVKVFDWAGNIFQTENRTLTIDNTSPLVTLDLPENATRTNINILNLSATLFDNSGLKNATLKIYNSEGNLYSSAFFRNGSGGGDLTDNLVAYYPLDGDVVDYSGNNYDGTNAGGASVTFSGKTSAAYVFDGSGNSYLSTANAVGNSFDGPGNSAGSFTFGVWAKFGDLADTGVHNFFVGKGTQGTWYDDMYLYFGHLANSGGHICLSFGYINSDGRVGVCTDQNYHNDNDWHYWVATHDVQNKTLNIYRDGINIANTTYANTVYYNHYDIPLTIGGFTGDCCYTSRFKGTIDEVSVWNKSLNLEQVSTLYNSGEGLSPLTPTSTSFVEGSSNLNVTKEITFADGVYTWNYGAGDLAGNVNSSENRTLTVDTTPPTISNVVYSPNIQSDLDPGQTLIFNATVSDALVGVNSVILQVHNSTDWSNYTMFNQSASLYFASMNLSWANGLNYTYRVWSNDTLNNAYRSPNGTFYSIWDCTWNYTTYRSPYNSLGTIAGYDTNKLIGNITIFNTGDANFTNNNCTLVFRLSNNLGANRIYFNESSLNPSDSYRIFAKTNRTININASFSASTSAITESLNIVVDDVYDRSEISARNVTGTLVTSQEGPYLVQDDLSYDSIIELVPGNFTLNAYLQNVMGDNLIATKNNTAYNVSFDWIVPSEFKNISGNSSIYFENISDASTHYNPLTLSYTNLENMGDGVKTFYLVSSGYKNLTGNLSLITDALGRSVLNDSFNITFTCKNVSGDGVCVVGCRYSHSEDSDCPEVNTGGGSSTGSSGGGGGGGSSTSSARVEKSEASFELVRGNQNEFQFEVKNKYDYDLTGVNITVSGINAEYIKISPSSFASLKARESKNITVKISAPAYFSGKKYTLIFDITGKMVDNSTGKKIDYTDRKAVTLSIVEIPRVQAEDLLINATNYLEEMNKSGMVLKEASALFSSLNGSYNEVEFGKVKQAYAQLKLLHDNAFEAKALIEELIASLADAKTNGIKTTEAKKLLLLGQTIYERGDYALALERLKEAKLTYALEVKGEFNLAYAIKNHPLESLGILIGLGLVSLGSGLAIRFQLLRRKLRMLNEEEVLLLELMKVIQKECIEKNHMSMEEYESAMFQYENRLSETVQEKITTETKIANLLKIKGKRIALGEEKNRLVGMIRKVQDDYLNKGTIETRIYENMIRSYTARLSEVQEKIATMDADEAVRHSKKLVD